MDDSVTEHDEVVLIPPVSGGDQPTATFSAVDLMAFLRGGRRGSGPRQYPGARHLGRRPRSHRRCLGAGHRLGVRGEGREFASLAVVVTAAGSAMAAHVAGGGGYALLW